MPFLGNFMNHPNDHRLNCFLIIINTKWREIRRDSDKESEIRHMCVQWRYRNTLNVGSHKNAVSNYSLCVKPCPHFPFIARFLFPFFFILYNYYSRVLHIKAASQPGLMIFLSLSLYDMCMWVRDSSDSECAGWRKITIWW